MSPKHGAEGAAFSIIIPLYNEEENVPILIETIFKEIGDHPDFLELVLVDDGSRDRTAELARAFRSQEPRIVLAQHDRNRGLGAGIRTGLQTARGDLILYTDADLPFDFSLIPQLISLAGQDRVISGCRVNRGEGLRRWVLTKGYNLLVYLCFGLYLRDINFACKVIPRSLARKISLQSEGSFIDAEILLEALRYGISIKGFPMTYHKRERGQSTLSRPGVILGILREMVRYALNHTSTAKPQNSLLRRSPLFRYGLAFLVTSLALLLSNLLPPSPIGPSPIFLASVFCVSLYGGWKPGLVTTTLSLLAIDLFLRPPLWSLTVGWEDLSLAILFLSALLIVPAINILRKRLGGEAEVCSED
jgi:glycosyltransferase involved in cell wall biosynthesis